MLLLNGISVLLFFGLTVFAVLTKEEGEACCPEKTANWKKEGIFLLLFLGLLAVRFFRFPQVPGGMNQDGAMGAVDAKALADYGTDRFGVFLPAHFKAWGYGQMSVLLSYLTVPFIRVLGLGKLAMRLPILIVSLLGMGGVYGAVKGTHGKRTARFALLLTAVNPWHFMQSRWALDCNLFPHMFILGFFFLMDGRKKKRSLYVSMVFFALSMYCYGVSFYMVPFFLLTACVILLRAEKVTGKEAVICMSIYFGIAWPLYGTMLINFMRWETVRLPFVTMPFFEESIRSADILFFSENMGEQLLINLKALLNVALWQREDLPWNSIKEFGTMYQCAMPFVILGAALVLRWAASGSGNRTGRTFFLAGRGQRTRQTAAPSGELRERADQSLCARLLAAFWGFGILTGLMINSVNVNRINIIFYVHIIFAAVGISFTVRRWKAFVPVIGAVFLIHYTCFCTWYFTRWAEEIDRAFYGDFVRALEYARDCESEYYCITPDTQYAGARQVTEILTLFVFEVDARYYQGAEEQSEGPAYEQRFRYANPGELGGPAQNITYVIKSSDEGYFPRESFQAVSFGEYAVVIPSK